MQSGSKPSLPFKYLEDITNNFAEERILGKGSFGVVYKGLLDNGEMVAVKKLLQAIPSSQEQLENEVILLMELEHQNIVRLVGYCYETEHKPMRQKGKSVFAWVTESLLCLEYLPNGSLDKYIKDASLNWHTRWKVIEGISYGLQYLHEHSNEAIIHLDLKPANILLDVNMLPKITDFGLSRLFDRNQTIRTACAGGTLGYMPPEYTRGIITPMWDIFSLGVIIMEVITGHRDYPDDIRKDSEGFIELELQKWRNGLQKEPGNTSLETDCRQIERCIQIGLICVNPNQNKRPTIKKIVDMLEGIESMNWYISNEIKPPYWEDDMLGVEPLELQFAHSGNDEQLILSCSIELSNHTDSFIAFKIQTTSPLPYSLEPNKDIVKPRSKCIVNVTLPAASTQDHNNKQYTKQFIVRSIKVNEGLTTNDMNEDMFDKYKMGHRVDEVYLSVISEEPCDNEVMDSPSNQAKKYASSSRGEADAIKPGNVQLVIKNNTVAPLLQNNKKVMLELTGGDYTSDRPGLDLVAVVDISYNMRGKKIDQLKTAMRFLVRKLSPMDRLSVIIFDIYAKELWPLRQITEASQRELEDIISKLEHSSSKTDIAEGLQDGLNVLAGREVRNGRVAGIMLVSSGYQTYGDATSVDVGDVPVYTFCFGGTDSDHRPTILHRVAAKSMGGTFSHVVDQDTGGLTMAFSQCLAGLLTVAVQNLELTVAAVRGESKIVKVRAGSYPQQLQKDDNDSSDSVTVRFGNLYSREVRKIIVELLLPTIYKGRSAEILDVTYSHNRSAGRMKSVATPETLTVWRTGMEFSEEEEKPAGLLSEEARLQTSQMIEEARTMADCSKMDDAQDKLVEALNMPEVLSNSYLRTELQELVELFKTQRTYENQGRPYALSSESCHKRQRLVGRGANIEVLRLFATPRMDKYLEQAKKFLNRPTMSMLSVDDDVMEEVGALTVDVPNREEEMRRLALDVVFMRKKPSPPAPGQSSIPDRRSGRFFRNAFRKR